MLAANMTVSKKSSQIKLETLPMSTSSGWKIKVLKIFENIAGQNENKGKQIFILEPCFIKCTSYKTNSNFKDHHTPNTIRGFGDLILVCKMRYYIIRKNFDHFHSFLSSDASDYKG